MNPLQQELHESLASATLGRDDLGQAFSRRLPVDHLGAACGARCVHAPAAARKTSGMRMSNHDAAIERHPPRNHRGIQNCAQSAEHREETT